MGRASRDGLGRPAPLFMSTFAEDARNLGAAFLAGAWALEPLVLRGAEALGRRERWLRPLVRRVLAAFPELPAATRLVSFVASDAGFCRGWELFLRPHVVGPRRLF